MQHGLSGSGASTATPLNSADVDTTVLEQVCS
jgi:hypothetical protein